MSVKIKENYTFFDLLDIMDILLGENGCPWDREQTHQSIKSNLIEEAYEAADAMDKTSADFVEELGDCFLQPVFHAYIAKKSGEFDISTVITALCKKLISRHEHVFGNVAASDADNALASWENAKEKGYQKTLYESLVLVPKNMPPSMRAQKVLKKLKRAGVELDKEDKARLDNALGALENAEKNANLQIDALIEKNKTPL